MKWNEPYVDIKVAEVNEPQRIVTTPRRYHVGSGDLTVYYNGSYAVKGKDYEEISPYSIGFLYDLEPGDKIIFHYQKLW